MNRVCRQPLPIRLARCSSITSVSRRYLHIPSRLSLTTPTTKAAAQALCAQVPIPRISTRTLSMETIATLKRISADQLAIMLREEHKQGIKAGGDKSKIGIVDVRDDDYLGGHINGSLNCPSRVLDTWMPTLLRKFADKEVVVFHCMLSQQRGPSAALQYAREKEIVDASHKRNGNDDEGKKQALYVLDLGFQGWQEKFGTDEVLTEGYRKELWEDY